MQATVVARAQLATDLAAVLAAKGIAGTFSFTAREDDSTGGFNGAVGMTGVYAGVLKLTGGGAVAIADARDLLVELRGH
jgi:hypothetical protein